MDTVDSGQILKASRQEDILDASNGQLKANDLGMLLIVVTANLA